MYNWAHKYNLYNVQIIIIDLPALFYFCQLVLVAIAAVIMKHFQDNP